MYQNKFTADEEDIRLDKFLETKLEITRSQIKKLIDDSSIKVNGKSEKAGYKLALGDEIDVSYQDEFELLPQKMDFRVLFEDEYLAVISKPQDLVVHPGAGNFENTLVNGLIYRFDKLALKDSIRPGIVHRLDKDTSGLMIIAKSDMACEKLIQMFKDKEVEKTYIAIVEGKLEEHGEIELPIGRDPSNRLKFTVIDENSKYALTKYRPLEVFSHNTLLEVDILTGRTHQIRVHMKHIGHPVLGDLLYGRKNKYGIKTQMLHSLKLEFKHPITGEYLSFEDEFPSRFSKFMRRSDI